jgi:hypothetical protein
MLRRATFLLSRSGVRRFERLLAGIDFWHRSPTPPPNPITDANTFLYEAARNGRYHVVEIDDPGSPALLPPARFLVQLVGEKMPE